MFEPHGRTLPRLALLALLALVAHYAFAPWMGLINDDWYFIAPAVNQHFAAMAHSAAESIRSMYWGRPLAYVLPLVAGWLVGAFGSFVPAFAMCWLIVTLNAWLLDRLVSVRFGPVLGLLAGVAFVLSPVDLTREYLIHGLSLQLALSFLLVALNAMVRGRPWVGLGVGALCLLTYESAYVLLVAAPLFAAHRWTRSRWLRLCAALLITVVACSAVRMAIGEPRVGEMTKLGAALVLRVAASLVLGPLFSIGLMLVGPFRSVNLVDLGNLSSSELPVLYLLFHVTLLAALVIAAIRMRLLSRIRALFSDDGDEGSLPTRQRAERLLLVGLVTLPVAYLLSFTHFPPNASIGFDMAVHLAASVPVALITAACAALIACRMRSMGRAARWLLPALYACGLLATAVRMQAVFAAEWTYQRSIYAGVLTLVPEMDSTTRVVLDVRTSDDPAEWAPMSRDDANLGLLVSPPHTELPAPLLVRADPRFLPLSERWYRRFEPGWYRARAAAYYGESDSSRGTPQVRRARDGTLEWQPFDLTPMWESVADTERVRLVHLVRDERGMHRMDGPLTLGAFVLPTSPPVQRPALLSRLGRLLLR